MPVDQEFRSIYYVIGFDNLDPLMKCVNLKYLTHVYVGFIHLGNADAPYVHLNNQDITDPVFQDLWDKVGEMQRQGVKVLATMGGGGVGDFKNLFSTKNPKAYDILYPLLRDTLKNQIKDSQHRTIQLDGLDLDIEEFNVTTDNVKKFIQDLRNDFPTGSGSQPFLISGAPVASDLFGGNNVTSVDWAALMDSFDYYAVQFYNNFGDLYTDYQGIEQAFGPNYPRFFVGGILTNPANGYQGYHPLSEVKDHLPELIASYKTFGGICGWNYHNALGLNGNIDQVNWADTISEQLKQKR